MRNAVNVLYLAANPTKVRGTELKEELDSITNRIHTTLASTSRAASDEQGTLEFIPCHAAAAENLLHELMEHKPSIVHFSGGQPRDDNADDGGGDDDDNSNHEIVAQDDLGQARAIDATALAHMLKMIAQSDKLRVVLLNSCHGIQEQVDAIKDSVDCTISIQQPICSRVGHTFSASFYRALGRGRSLQDAFNAGKSSLLLAGVAADQIPEIFVRPGGIDSTKTQLVQPLPPSKNPVFESIWNSLDEDLQDAFALAATAARRDNKDYISTTTLFAALRRLSPSPLNELFGYLPEGSLPESTPDTIVEAEVMALDEIVSLSPCVNAAMVSLTPVAETSGTEMAKRISSEDMFVDVALHGNSKSTVLLRTHGVDQAKVQEIVRQLGHNVLMRKPAPAVDYKDQVREVPHCNR